MLNTLTLVLLAVYALFSEICAHSAKIRGNSTLQFIRGLLKKGVEETGATQKLSDEFSAVEAAASAPVAAPAATPNAPQSN